MIDPRHFNVRDKLGKLLCPACGFPDYLFTDAYSEKGGTPLGICPCCLWEPGFDDNPAASTMAQDTILGSLRAHRAEWSAAFEWKGYGPDKPADWDPSAQLANLFEAAPHVR